MSDEEPDVIDVGGRATRETRNAMRGLASLINTIASTDERVTEVSSDSSCSEDDADEDDDFPDEDEDDVDEVTAEEIAALLEEAQRQAAAFNSGAENTLPTVMADAMRDIIAGDDVESGFEPNIADADDDDNEVQRRYMKDHHTADGAPPVPFAGGDGGTCPPFTAAATPPTLTLHKLRELLSKRVNCDKLWEAQQQAHADLMRAYPHSANIVNIFHRLMTRDMVLQYLNRTIYYRRGKGEAPCVIIITVTDVRFTHSEDRVLSARVKPDGDDDDEEEEESYTAERCADRGMTYAARVDLDFRVVKVTIPTHVREACKDQTTAVALAMQIEQRASDDASSLARYVQATEHVNAPMVFIPVPIGLQPDAPDLKRPHPLHLGSFQVRGKNLHMHLPRRQIFNSPLAIRDKTGLVSVQNRSVDPKSCRSSATLIINTSKDGKLTATLAWPRDSKIPLAMLFRLLGIHSVDDMLAAAWPFKVPSEENAARLRLKGVLLKQVSVLPETYTEMLMMLPLIAERLKDDQKKTAEQTDAIKAASRASTIRMNTNTLIAQILPDQTDGLPVPRTDAKGIARQMGAKALGVGHMVRLLMVTSLGIRPVDDRNSAAEQQFVPVDQMLTQLLCTAWITAQKKLLTDASRAGSQLRVTAKSLRAGGEAQRLINDKFVGGSSDSQVWDGVFQPDRDAPFPMAGAGFRRAVGIDRKAKLVQNTADGVEVHNNTPDSKHTGVVGSSTYHQLNMGIPKHPFEFEATVMLSLTVAPVAVPTDSGATPWYFQNRDAPLLCINGHYAARVLDPPTVEGIIANLRLRRTAGDIPPLTAIYASKDMPYYRVVHVRCMFGDSFFPTIHVARIPDFIALLAAPSTPLANLETLAHHGVLTWMCPQEALYGGWGPIAADMNQLRDATHMDFKLMFLHPMQPIAGAQLSRVAHLTASEQPRIGFVTQQLKQATSGNVTNPKHHVAPQAPLATTLGVEVDLKEAKICSGQSCVVAIVALPNTNEDGAVMNKAAAERGLGATVYTLTYTISRQLRHMRDVHVTNLDTEEYKAVQRIQGADYSQLDEEGIIREGGEVLYTYDEVLGETTYTVLASRVQLVTDPSRVGRVADASVVFKKMKGVPFKVDKVVKTTTNFRIKLSAVVFVQDGDKITTDQAQKKTLTLVPQENLPFDAETGIVADVFLSPYGMKRGTPALPAEGAVSMLAAVTGERIDCTTGKPMGSFDREIMQKLRDNKGSVKKTLIDGISGRCIIADWVGILHLKFLAKHSAIEKVSARPVFGGKKTAQRQANKGRKEGGGHRYGEMESLASFAYGASHISQDVGKRSDTEITPVCKKCHTIARNKPHTLLTSAMPEDRTPEDVAEMERIVKSYDKCFRCGGDVVNVHMSYVAQQLSHKLNAAGIMMEFHVKESGGDMHRLIEETRARLADAVV